MSDTFATWRDQAVTVTETVLKAEAADVDRILLKLQLLIQAFELLYEPTAELLEEIVRQGGLAAIVQIGADQSIVNQVNERAVQYARDRAAEMVGKKWVGNVLIDNPNVAWRIDEATRAMLRRDLVAAVEEGASNDAIAERIRDSYVFSDERAITIARTETAFADVAGNVAAYRASGQVASKEWLVAEDCCDDCQALDGEVVPLDAKFSDGSEGAPAHPNCRCDVLPVLIDLDEADRSHALAPARRTR